MKRSPMPPRKTRLPRSTTPMRPRRKRTAEQEAAKFEREYGSHARCEWVKSLDCLVPGCPNEPENAHVVTIDGGTSRKGHYTGIAPLCFKHHRHPVHGLHKLGVRSFERLHAVSLADCAARTEALWREREAAA